MQTRDYPAPDADAATGERHDVATIADLFAALQACWMPPPLDRSQTGMQMSIRFSFKRNGELIAPPRRTYSSIGAAEKIKAVYLQAISAAIERCAPMPFTKGLGGAIAGRPIAIRFVDDRGSKCPEARLQISAMIQGGLRTRLC